MPKEFYNENVCEIVEKIINKSNEGKVICVHGEWGTGKTFFCNQFSQRNMERSSVGPDTNGIEKFNVIYFNSFQSDFDADPIIAIVASVANALSADERKSFLKEISESTLLNLPLLLSLGSGVVKNLYPEAENEFSSAEDILEAIANQLSQKAEHHQSLKPSELKDVSSLQKILSAYLENKKVVFLVDELDRCRPTYAVEVIEKIKHIFGSVDGKGEKTFYFLLAMDKEQLIGSINHFYGLGQKSSIYLEKFIDLTVELKPQNSISSVVENPFAYYFFNIAGEKISAIDVKSKSVSANDYSRVMLFLTFLVERGFKDQANISFRKMDRLCDFIVVGLIVNEESFEDYFDVLVFCCCLYVMFFDPEKLGEYLNDNFYKGLFEPSKKITEISNFPDSNSKVLALNEGEKELGSEFLYINSQGYKDFHNNKNLYSYAKMLYEGLGVRENSLNGKGVHTCYIELVEKYKIWSSKARRLI